MAAAPGNQYAAKARIWTQAIERAIKKRSRVEQVEALDALAEKLIEKVEQGDLAAIKELGDRLEGKPSQQINHAGHDGGPLQVSVTPADADA